jgi:hypothetical protein
MEFKQTFPVLSMNLVYDFFMIFFINEYFHTMGKKIKKSQFSFQNVIPFGLINFASNLID